MVGVIGLDYVEIRQGSNRNLLICQGVVAWDTTLHGQSVKGGDPIGYFANSLAI